MIADELLFSFPSMENRGDDVTTHDVPLWSPTLLLTVVVVETIVLDILFVWLCVDTMKTVSDTICLII